MNWSIDARTVVKLEDIAINRKAKLSPIVQEILDLGIEYYEREETKRICNELRREEAVVKQTLSARPARGDHATDTTH